MRATGDRRGRLRHERARPLFGLVREAVACIERDAGAYGDIVLKQQPASSETFLTTKGGEKDDAS